MLNLTTSQLKPASLGLSSSPAARMLCACEDLYTNSYGAYSPEFLRIKDWSSQYSFICDTNINNLESQPRLNSGGQGKKLTVPK